MAMYFKGGSGLSEPKDINGDIINIGDHLTRDYGDYESCNISIKEEYSKESFYEVKYNEEDGFFYAESIEYCTATIEKTRFYLHDFRFKYCKIIKHE